MRARDDRQRGEREREQTDVQLHLRARSDAAHRDVAVGVARQKRALEGAVGFPRGPAGGLDDSKVHPGFRVARILPERGMEALDGFLHAPLPQEPRAQAVLGIRVHLPGHGPLAQISEKKERDRAGE